LALRVDVVLNVLQAKEVTKSFPTHGGRIKCSKSQALKVVKVGEKLVAQEVLEKFEGVCGHVVGGVKKYTNLAFARGVVVGGLEVRVLFFEFKNSEYLNYVNRIILILVHKQYRVAKKWYTKNCLVPQALFLCACEFFS
jgi:hypothetical protein